MGTSTIFQRFNDFGGRLSQMSKEDLEKIDAAKAWKDDRGHLPCGWQVPLELHNGNIDVLVWWKGQLMNIRNAPKTLNKKYYDRHSGKTLRIYEWTVFRKFCLMLLDNVDSEFRKSLRRRKEPKKGKISTLASKGRFFQ